MAAFPGVDIGRFGSNGRRLGADGRTRTRAAGTHRRILRQPGSADPRLLQGGWQDDPLITARLLAQTRLPPQQIGAIGVLGIVSCRLPIDGADTARCAAAPLGEGVATGGGMRCQVALQKISDICAISQTLPAPTSGASLGDAMPAPVAIGAASAGELRGRHRPAGRIRPDPGPAGLSDRRRAICRQSTQRAGGRMAERP